MTETEEGFSVQIPLSSLIRQGGDLEYVLRECVLLPGRLYYRRGANREYYVEPLELKSSECRICTGSLHYTDRFGNLTYTEEDSPYLQLSLAERNQAVIAALAEILPLEEGCYALRVYFKEENAVYFDTSEQFRNAITQARRQGVEELFLCVDGKPWLQASLETADLEACTLDFTRMRILSGEKLREEHLGLLRLLVYQCGNYSSLFYKVKEYDWDRNAAAFCFTERQPEQILFEEFFAADPRVEWSYEGSSLYVYLYPDLRSDFISQGFNFTEKLITELDLLSTCCQNVYINFGRGEGACRLVIIYESQLDTWMTGELDTEVVQPGYVSFIGVCYGKDYDPFTADFLRECARRELYRHFDYEK